MQTIKVGEIELAWNEAGRGERPFVLVHGFTGSRDDFREQVEALAPLGRTLALDQRGHGDSTNAGTGYTLEQLADDLEGFARELDLGSFDLLGHSMGGMVVLRFALARPERVRSLVLMDTSHRPLQTAARGAMEAAAHVARTRGMEGLFDAMRANPQPRPEAALRLQERLGDEFWERQRRKLTSMDVEAFSGLSRAMHEQESLLDRLGEIRCPTTVIVGEQDEAFLEPSREMAEGIPDAIQVTIPDAAHSPQLENAPAWTEAVRAHLERARR